MFIKQFLKKNVSDIFWKGVMVRIMDNGGGLLTLLTWTLLLISGMASTYPEPEDKGAFIHCQLYDTEYRPAIPTTYAWPKK